MIKIKIAQDISGISWPWRFDVTRKGALPTLQGSFDMFGDKSK